MRARTIMTVALLSAGCGTSGTAASGRPAAGEPRAAAPAVTAVPAPVTRGTASTGAAAPLAPAQLARLADELRATEAPQVAARAAHFRPLCDAEGYPLVGNVIMKSANAPRPIAAFCDGVRSGR